ncbi:MAG: ribose 5-phosphate isomerase A, partial [Alphaproteobacteria bacterium]
HLKRIGEPRQLSLMLNQVPGVVENGLFIDICDVVIIGASDGSVEIRDINNGTVSREQIDELDDDNIFRDVVD